MSNYVVAIDLGTTKVVSIVGEKSADKYRILAYSENKSNGIRRGQIDNVEKVINVVTPTLNHIKAELGISEIKEVFVGIAGQYIKCIENRAELIRRNYEEMISEEEVKKLESDARSLHLNSGEEVLHAVPKTYSIDGTDDIFDPVGYLGHKIVGHFHVIVGNETTRIHTNVCMKRLKLSLQNLIVEPIASARATLSEEEKEMGVVMIDMGGGTTDLIVYNGGVVRHTAVIPFGGNSITEDLQKGCAILYEKAEETKVKYGSCIMPSKYDNKVVVVPGINGREPREIQMSRISEIIIARLDEIMEMVMNELNTTDCGGRLSAGIVFTGGVSKMKGIEEFLRQKTNMDVKIGKPDYISNDSPEEIVQPKYSTAVGLIMCGFDYLDSLIVEKQDEKNHQDDEEDPDEDEDPDDDEDPIDPKKDGFFKIVGNGIKKIVLAFMNPQQDEKIE
ncbi:MAG: cell division protein FtsA [Prevotellaceae bacterium]|jgi:cell division protein FtsA|nr:cell division protein FtsA [Prevotellaceae bacterium]